MNQHLGPIVLWCAISLVVLIAVIVIALRVGDARNRRRGVTTQSMKAQADLERRPGIPEDLE